MSHDRLHQIRFTRLSPHWYGTLVQGQPIFYDKVYNIFNRELQKYQLNFRQHT